MVIFKMLSVIIRNTTNKYTAASIHTICSQVDVLTNFLYFKKKNSGMADLLITPKYSDFNVIQIIV